PTPAHAAVGMAVLERGIALLMEKPLADTVAAADQLVRRAGDRGVVLQVGHVERFNRAVRAAAPYLEEPRFLQIDRLAPFQPRGTDVAVILDLMIHDLDLVLELVRAEVTDVRATGVPLLTPHVDIANARIEFANGAVANVTASRVSRERTRKLRIFQPTGYFSLDLAQRSGDFYRLRAGWQTPSRPRPSPPRGREPRFLDLHLGGRAVGRRPCGRRRGGAQAPPSRRARRSVRRPAPRSRGRRGAGSHGALLRRGVRRGP